VAHLSTRNSVAMVAFAKSRGLTVTAEATPHHFAITDSELANYDSNYKMKPPLRNLADVDAVIDGIVAGTIDAIATDHAPHTGSQKMQEFERCPFGITGLETAIGLSLERLVHSGKISVTRLIALFTTGPERILKLGRGTLAEGAAADVTIFDLDSDWTFLAERSHSKSKNSPFDGRKFRGGPFATVVSGQIVWRRT
jgi:dihydroorotase